MKETFFYICEQTIKQLNSDEELIISFSGENSQYIRFNNAKKSDRGKIQHPQDPDSFTTDTFLTLDGGHKVVISCYDWSKNLESEGYSDQLRISLWTKELNDWLVR